MDGHKAKESHQIGAKGMATDWRRGGWAERTNIGTMRRTGNIKGNGT